MATVNKRKTTFNLKTWVLEVRPQYLLLPLVLILVGTGVAWWEGYLNIGYAFLALLGLVLCHISVNVLNDYFDYVSGVDLKTLKTPFSGGSGILPANRLRAKQVLWYGIICFILAVPIGIYFTVSLGWQLLPLVILGAICILFYTSVILKIHFPEWSPGLGLGILPVLGAYFVQTGHYSFSALIAAVPSGFLVLNLLLLNEFPDADADKTARKKTLPITMGKRNAAIVYTAFTAATYVWILGAWAFGTMPVLSLIALLTIPLAVKAVRGAFKYNDLGQIIPAMGNNVLVVLITQALLGISYFLSAVLFH